jgi:hypothetical protein
VRLRRKKRKEFLVEKCTEFSLLYVESLLSDMSWFRNLISISQSPSQTLKPRISYRNNDDGELFRSRNPNCESRADHSSMT